MKTFKIITFVPEKDADRIRNVLGKAGAGKIGNYEYCSFSTKGVGRFLPQEGASPTIGEVGKLEEVNEEKVEVVCQEEKLNNVLRSLKEAHPYEEPATEVYELVEVD